MIVKDMLEAEGRLRCLHLLLLTSTSLLFFVALRKLYRWACTCVNVERSTWPNTISCTHLIHLAVPNLAAFFPSIYGSLLSTFLCNFCDHQSSCPPLKIHFVHVLSFWGSTQVLGLDCPCSSKSSYPKKHLDIDCWSMAQSVQADGACGLA